MTATVLALSGGIGGAKLALGLYRTLPANTLGVAANPGDDFEHLGFTICPDFDTVLYTLAGVVNPETGWGRADESWNFMQTIEQLGGDTWFQLGDRDLAVHSERTRRLASGERLTDINRSFARSFGVNANLLPVTDEAVRTVVETPDGDLAFQDYFVRQRAQPSVTGFRFVGADTAKPTQELLDAIDDASVIVICPSNPFISIDPVLAIPGVIEALQTADAPVVAVSPVVGAEAIKGPTAKIMRELDLAVSAETVVERYASFINGFVVDTIDAELKSAIEERFATDVLVTPTVMRSLGDRDQLARAVVEFGESLRAG